MESNGMHAIMSKNSLWVKTKMQKHKTVSHNITTSTPRLTYVDVPSPRIRSCDQSTVRDVLTFIAQRCDRRVELKHNVPSKDTADSDVERVVVVCAERKPVREDQALVNDQHERALWEHRRQEKEATQTSENSQIAQFQEATAKLSASTYQLPHLEQCAVRVHHEPAHDLHAHCIGVDKVNSSDLVPRQHFFVAVHVRLRFADLLLALDPWT